MAHVIGDSARRCASRLSPSQSDSRLTLRPRVEDSQIELASDEFRRLGSSRHAPLPASLVHPLMRLMMVRGAAR